jgi:hypothetical protein
VKCDAAQPKCGRCRRDRKECTYQKSRRGGLDKAALARRRLRLQQQAENGRPSPNGHGGEQRSSTESASPQELDDFISIPDFHALSILGTTSHNAIGHQVNTVRLLDLYYENFHPATPVLLPRPFLDARKMSDKHGLNHILYVIHWIGSLYAPATPSKPLYGMRARYMLDSCLSQLLNELHAALCVSDIVAEAKLLSHRKDMLTFVPVIQTRRCTSSVGLICQEHLNQFKLFCCSLSRNSTVISGLSHD